MDNLNEEEISVHLLIIRFLEGTISDEESVRLQEWLDSSEEHAALFHSLEDGWLKSGAPERYDVGKAWQQMGGRLEQRKRAIRKRSLHRVMSYAAILVLAFTAGAYWYVWQSSPDKMVPLNEEILPGTKKALLILGSNQQIELGNEQHASLTDGNAIIKNEDHTLLYEYKEGAGHQDDFNRLVTPRGGEYSVILSDGTKVWLNAESELKYPVQFAGSQRIVYLKGEAYFQVTHQDSVPFIVCSGDTKITVLGTEFNVRNYEADEVTATLVKGSVRISDSWQHVRRLEPGQQAVCQGKQIEVKNVETILYTAWKDGFFIYREKTLDNILQELSRWYDFTYFYQNSGIGENVLTAKLQKFDSVDKIFEILSETGKYQFVRKGRTVTVIAK